MIEITGVLQLFIEELKNIRAELIKIEEAIRDTAKVNGEQK